MITLVQYADEQLMYGRAWFGWDEALAALGATPGSLRATVARLIKKGRLANPRHGFYLILRPEDRVAGAPDPARWIDPLMRHQGLDYRISLLRAAALHGAAHQAAMNFQVIVPRQLRPIQIGRHRVEFVYQHPTLFSQVNQDEWLTSLKTDAGFAKAAGVELTLLDCARYFHKAAGIDGLAQIVKDLGGLAAAGKLRKLAAHYENTAVRRLGYLLDCMGYTRQAAALASFVHDAKSYAPLDPSAKSLVALPNDAHEKDSRWKLALNIAVEVDF